MTDIAPAPDLDATDAAAPSEAPLAAAARASASPDALASLADVEIEVTVELGRRRLSIAELSQLGVGHVVELDTLAGEPVVIFANGRRIATGDVVVVDEQLGVRVAALEARA